MKYAELETAVRLLQEELAEARRGVAMTGRIHRIRTWPEPFQAVADGRKRYDVRRDDRGYAVGDELFLEEWDPSVYQDRKRNPVLAVRAFGDAYTGRLLRASVTYVTRGGQFELPPNLCVLSLGRVELGVRVVELGVTVGFAPAEAAVDGCANGSRASVPGSAATPAGDGGQR